MTRARETLLFLYTQKLGSSFSFRVEAMISSVVRAQSSDIWSYVIKPRLFRFLFHNIILESFDSGPKELKRKGFFLDLERTFVDFILSRSGFFRFEVISVSFSGSFIQICFVIQRFKICSDSCWFKNTGWWVAFLAMLKFIEIQLIFARANIYCMVEWKSSCLVLAPNCACQIECSFFIRIVMAWT